MAWNRWINRADVKIDWRSTPRPPGKKFGASNLSGNRKLPPPPNSGGQLSMVTMETLRGEKRAAIVTLGARYGASNIRVFGSVAQGRNQEASDVDFVVDFEKGRTLFDLIGLRLDLLDLLGVEVDIVTPRSLRYLRDRILAEAKAI